MILAKSPYYVDISYYDAVNDITEDFITINLYTNTTDSAGVYDLTYTFELDTITEFDVSNYLLDNIKDNEVVFFKYDIVYPTNSQVVQFNDILTISNGYLYSTEPKNTQVTNNVLLTSTENYVYKGERILFSYLHKGDANDFTEVKVTSKPNGDTTQNYDVTTSTLANNIIRSVEFDTINVINDSYLEIEFTKQDNSKLIYYYDVLNSPITTTSEIVFLNKYGAKENIHFVKKHKETQKVTKNTFLSYADSPINGYHNKRDFNVNSDTSFTLETPYLLEEMNETIKQLMLSDRVWIVENGIELPVNIKSNSNTYKNVENDTLISYSLNFEYSFNDIANV